MTDPVTLAVVRGALEECVYEMDDNVVASAFSPIISEGKDRAHGLFEANGDLVVQGEASLPLFIGSLQASMRKVVTQPPLDPGDVIVHNHPEVGGTHVQDVKLITPVHFGGEIVFYLGSAAHWMDVGGAVGGGWHPHSTTVYAEGLVIDGVRIVRSGELNGDVLSMLRSNARMPDPLEGDLSAQLSALRLGAHRLEEIVARHGLDAVLAVVAQLQRRSEEEARARFRELAGRRAHAEDMLDNDGIVDEPIRIVCDLEFTEDGLVLDLTGSSDQVEGPINLTVPGTLSSCQIAVKHWWPEIPINAGCFRALEVRTRPGSVLAAAFPCAVSGYSDVMQRVIDVVIACLGQVEPERSIASAFGTTGGISITWKTERGVSLAAWYLDGGYGATPAGDGFVGGSPLHSTSDLPPVEVFEHRAPVRFVERSLRPGSGGAGETRGGCGSIHEFEFLAPCTIAFIGDRTRKGPSGIGGGGEGGRSRWSFTIGGEERLLPLGGKGVVSVSTGDRMRIETPGGGGRGDPARRAPEQVELDRRNGYVA